MESYFDLFKQSILKQGVSHNACKRFINGIESANNYADIQSVLFKFWPSIIMEHRNAALDFLATKYEGFKTDFNAIRIFFNEDTDCGRAIYYSSDGNLGCFHLKGEAEGWALGKSYVSATCRAKLIGRDESVCYYEKLSKGQLFDHSVGRLYDGSSVSLNGHATIHALSINCSFVAGGGSTVFARSFRHGKAFGKSVVKGPTDKNLQLFDEAKYIKMNIQ